MVRGAEKKKTKPYQRIVIPDELLRHLHDPTYVPPDHPPRDGDHETEENDDAAEGDNADQPNSYENDDYFFEEDADAMEKFEDLPPDVIEEMHADLIDEARIFDDEHLSDEGNSHSDASSDVRELFSPDTDNDGDDIDVDGFPVPGPMPTPEDAAANTDVNDAGYAICRLEPWASRASAGHISEWPADAELEKRSVSCRCYLHVGCSVLASRRRADDVLLLRWLYSGRIPPLDSTYDDLRAEGFLHRQLWDEMKNENKKQNI